jgi:ketosteroid isomerase-like protein
VFISGIDPTIEWHAVLQRLVEGPEILYRGHEGMRRLWHDYRTELDYFEIEAQEIRDLGDGRVVLMGRTQWRGPGSGIEVESPVGMVITVRDEKMIKSIDYLSHEETLKPQGWRGRRCRRLEC